MLLSGCATAMLSSADVSDTKVTSNLVLEDEIIATGYPKQTTNTDIEKNGMVLVGANNTYYITDGFKEIGMLVTLTPSKIHINKDLPIHLVMDSNNKFYGVIKVEYSGDDYTQSELNSLHSLYFSEEKRAKGWLGLSTKNYYAKEFFVKGNIYSKLNINEPGLQKLKNGRMVKFFTVKTEKTVSTTRIADKLFTLPFAIAFDVVTAPAQIIFLSSQGR